MISVDKSALFEYTLLPNAFIDSYFAGTDGDYIKVYIYLLRSSETDKASLETAFICEALDMDEDKVLKALKHWEAEGLTELFYTEGRLSGIRFLSPSKAAKARDKHRLTAERVRQLKKEDADARQLVFLAENYFGRPLTAGELGTLLYLHDKLGFSVDLCDYLLEYSVSHGAKNMKYAETVALAWHSEGITTVETAKAHSRIRTNPSAEGSEVSQRPKTASKNAFLNFDQHDYDMKELERKAKKRGKADGSD